MRAPWAESRVGVCKYSVVVTARDVLQQAQVCESACIPAANDDRLARFAGGAPWHRRLRDVLEIANTPLRHVQDALRFPNSQARMSRRIGEQLVQGNPIVVFSAPKTASTSIASALDRSVGLDTVKVHMVQPEHFWHGPLQRKTAPDGLLRHRAIEQVPSRELLFDTGRSLRVVSVVREPVAFNLSNYTYFGRAYWMRSIWRSAPWMDTARLMKHFLASFPHESSSLWWEHEFARIPGINLLREGFNCARGWQRYQRGRFDCLVIRADISDAAKREALCAWTGVDVSPIERENSNDTQSAPGVYERLKRAMRGQAAYVDAMLDLPSMQVFYSAEHRAALRARWMDA